MKKSILFLAVAFTAICFMPTMWLSSCKKSGSSNPSTDSCVFYFHLHTEIVDSTIGGNSDGVNGGADSNTTGNTCYPWYFDSLGRHIELQVPQFFISNIMLVTQGGKMVMLNNAVLLKGLDSEDYYLAKVPVGTYVSAMFTVGLTNADSTMNPSMNIITSQNPYPIESTMWNESSGNYYGMYIKGAYDTSAIGRAGGTPVNPIPFTFAIPNGLTIQYPITLPTRTLPASQTYGIYVATAGSINYVHIYCDYGKLLTAVNLMTSNNTATDPLIADSLAKKLPDMFRYEQ